MREIPIVLIGHKDHGKSTLIGRMILDSGSIKKDKVEEIKSVDESFGQKFELAHLLDSFKEEREREMTMDTTRALLKGKKRFYQLIDVPGHRELISHMLTGASGAEVALLVVSIEEGIKEQTRQHLEIAHLLGIEQLIVIINKMDKVNYQKSAFDKLVKELKIVLKKIGYLLKNIYFFPISALEGDNVFKKSSRIPWYSGPNLMDFFEKQLKPQKSFIRLPLRFLVQDVYPERDEEILVGRVESGKIRINQDILFLPSNKKDSVKSIRDSEDELNEASAGENIGVILRNKSEISRGMVGVPFGHVPQLDNLLSGEIFWIKKPSQSKLECECGTNRAEGKLQGPKGINQGRKTFYKIKLKSPIVFEPDSKTLLGKIVLKDKGKIIGVGNIRTRLRQNLDFFEI